MLSGLLASMASGCSMCVGLVVLVVVGVQFREHDVALDLLIWVAFHRKLSFCDQSHRYPARLRTHCGVQARSSRGPRLAQPNKRRGKG